VGLISSITYYAMALRSRLVILLAVLVALGYSVVHLTAFIQLFYEHDGIALTQVEIRDAHLGKDGGSDKRLQEIPKIIHQVYHNWAQPGNTTMPADWEKVRNTCVEKNKDWQYMVSLVT